MTARVLVAGIGNVFLGDDGFGVEVVRRLARGPLPDGVTVSDVGIRSLHLAYALLDRPELLVVVDAVSRGEAPGTLYLIDPNEPNKPNKPNDPNEAAVSPNEIPDAHGMSVETVLAAVRTLGGEPPPTLIVGCEPAFIGERMGLSPAVEDALPRAGNMIRATIARQLGIAVPVAVEEKA
ncbi:MAG TPA: hydrogenase maturation protease [Polyangia bacterium]|jgi:hydrogenase maturation protease|nr:hydrogenase maturation protease [Polyangia bacterium]